MIAELKCKPEGMDDISWLSFCFSGKESQRKSLRKRLPKETVEILEEIYKQNQKYERKKYSKKKKYKTNKEYDEYIHSKEWRVKRKEKLSVQSCCEMCGSKDNLHVHHNSYENFKNEKMEDLNVLCAKCHAEIHS